VGTNINAYYRIQGPHLVIEYAPQSDEPTNHVHTIYRDPTNDYGQGVYRKVKRRLIAVALLGMVSLPAWAHRLDEYLQATIFSIEPGSVKATMRPCSGRRGRTGC